MSLLGRWASNSVRWEVRSTGPSARHRPVERGGPMAEGWSRRCPRTTSRQVLIFLLEACRGGGIGRRNGLVELNECWGGNAPCRTAQSQGSLLPGNPEPSPTSGRCRDLTGSTYVRPDTVKRKSRPRTHPPMKIGVVRKSVGPCGPCGFESHPRYRRLLLRERAPGFIYLPQGGLPAPTFDV